MILSKILKGLTLSVLVVGLLVGCSDANAEEASQEIPADAFTEWATAELDWPDWAAPIEMEITDDIKYGPMVRKTYTLEEAHEAIGKLRYLVENTEADEAHPYHNIWVNNLGSGLLNLGEYQLAYHFLNEVYELPDDAVYGTKTVDDSVVASTKGEEKPQNMLHGRLIKAVANAGFSEKALELYHDYDYTDYDNIHSWGLTSAAWGMGAIGETEEALKLFDLSYQPEPFGEENPYQSTTNILAAASFAYHHGDYDKVLEYTERLLSEDINPINMDYFAGANFDSERHKNYYQHHWESSYKLASGLRELALEAKEGHIADFENLKDGVYTSSHTGYMLTPITVEVHVEDGNVTEIAVSQEEEKDDRSAAALATLPNRIIEKQSLAVDAISSATISSESLKLSVADALLEAKGEE